MDDETDPDAQRRTVLRGAAAAALLSIGGSFAGSARDGDGTGDPERERAAEMLREFYDGYLEGIDDAVATEVQMEASTIEDGRNEPWPLDVWDDVEDARQHGVDLGAGEGGSQPFRDAYNSFDRAHDSNDADGDRGDGDEDESEGDAIDTFVDGEFCPK